MKTITAAIINMAATAIVWANTAEAVFRVTSFMALPLHSRVAASSVVVSNSDQESSLPKTTR